MVRITCALAVAYCAVFVTAQSSCEFETTVDTFLRGYASSCGISPQPLDAALEACCNCESCAGVTCPEVWRCTLSESFGREDSINGETSYKKLMNAQCHETCVASFESVSSSRYLDGYACTEARFSSLLDAKQECCRCGAECGGVTASADLTEYTTRAEIIFLESFSNETSYIKAFTPVPLELPGRELCYEKCTPSLAAFQLVGRLASPAPVNLNKAHNALVWPLLQPALLAHRDISYGTLGYQDFGGTLELREAMANMMQTHVLKMDPPIDSAEMAQRLSIVSGARAALKHVLFAVLDEGDGVIIPAPYYSSLVLNVCDTFGGHTIPAYMRSDEGFQLNVEIFQEAYDLATSQGITVKAILITNPNNPTGHAYTREILEPLLDWAVNLNLHIISDELYALSKFDVAAPDFISVAQIVDPRDYDRVHIVYGLSKDWGMPGLRVGVLYTESSEVLDCVHIKDDWAAVSSDTQYTLTRLLNDETFVTSYLADMQQILQNRYILVKERLDQHSITHLTAGGAGTHGLYLFLDLREYLPAPDFMNERGLLWGIEDNALVTLGRGELFGASEPGWARLVFTSVLDDVEILAAIDTVAALLGASQTA